MDQVNLTDVGAELGALVERVEAGEVVEITRHGESVARLIPARGPRKPIDLDMLQALTAGMPATSHDAVTLVRSMRDDDRF